MCCKAVHVRGDDWKCLLSSLCFIFDYSFSDLLHLYLAMYPACMEPHPLVDKIQRHGGARNSYIGPPRGEASPRDSEAHQFGSGNYIKFIWECLHLHELLHHLHSIHIVRHHLLI